jgi:hypothetical protein
MKLATRLGKGCVLKLHHLPRWIWTQLPLYKDTLAALQSALTILAFVAAVWWFAMQGYTQPTVQVDHKVQQRPMLNSGNTSLIWIEIRVTNSGKVPVDLETGCVQLTVDLSDVIDPAIGAVRKQPVKYDLSNGGTCPTTDIFEHVIASDKSDTVLVYSQPLETKRLKKIRLHPGESDQAAVFSLVIPNGLRVVKLHTQYVAPWTFLGLRIPFVSSHMGRWDWVRDSPVFLPPQA